MHAIARRALNAYANVGIETGVQAADPHKLVLMLFEGAMLAVSDARRHLERGEIAAKGSSISKAIAIIDGGLRVSLDVTAGGALGEKLSALYQYMCERLLHANLHGRMDLLNEVYGLLAELNEAWMAIGSPAAPAIVHASAQTTRSSLPRLREAP